ncbi:MAG: hypothetical protein Q7U37_05735 [Gallionella sp.]|nr:hypothetical protein [Gallionella sp.]
MSLTFGSGFLYGINAAANSTPIKLGKLQDVSFDFSFTLKELRGQSQFPLDVRRGSGKLTGKAKFAELNGRALNDLFFSGTSATGLLLSAVNEVGTVTTATVTVANAATFDTDLGVVYGATGLPLTKVASAPAAGQYSVSVTGVYTFNTADNTKQVLIDYLYNATTGGSKITLGNALMGNTPTFMGVFSAQVGGKTNTLKLNSCTSSKLALATKLEDYAIPELDFEAMADATGSLGIFSVAD